MDGRTILQHVEENIVKRSPCALATWILAVSLIFSAVVIAEVLLSSVAIDTGGHYLHVILEWPQGTHSLSAPA